MMNRLSLNEQNQVKSEPVIKETPRPTAKDVQEAFQTGWRLRGDDDMSLHLPGDISCQWCANWHILPDIRVPHWLRRRLDEIKALKQTQEIETQQAQDSPLYTKSFLAAPSEHPSTFTWCSTEDCVGRELVEQGKTSYIQEVESSLSSLRSPCERG